MQNINNKFVIFQACKIYENKKYFKNKKDVKRTMLKFINMMDFEYSPKLRFIFTF